MTALSTIQIIVAAVRMGQRVAKFEIEPSVRRSDLHLGVVGGSGQAGVFREAQGSAEQSLRDAFGGPVVRPAERLPSHDSGRSTAATPTAVTQRLGSNPFPTQAPAQDESPLQKRSHA